MPELLLRQVCEVVAEVFRADPAAITADTVAADVNGWDSVTHTILILELERRFAVEIPLEATTSLGSVGELAVFLARRQTAGR